MWSRLWSRDTARPAQRPLVNVYRVGDTLIVETNDKTVAGYYVGTDRVTRVPATVTDDELGNRILAALKAALEGVPAAPPNAPSSPRVKALVKAAGRRSYAAVVREAVLVRVQRDGERLRFTPMRNGGPTGPGRGFYELDVEPLSSSSVHREIGQTVRAALDLATPCR
jgi:hypothetical protein